MLSIVVSDRDGTPVIRVNSDDITAEVGLATRPAFIATFAMATDQASKLGLGKNQSIICMYSNYQVGSYYFAAYNTHKIRKSNILVHFGDINFDIYRFRWCN